MNGFYYIFLIRQDLQDYRDIFCLHQFPEEIDETQATFGGKKKPRIIDIPLFNLTTKIYLYFIVIIEYLAAGDWVFFVSSANKE